MWDWIVFGSFLLIVFSVTVTVVVHLCAPDIALRMRRETMDKSEAEIVRGVVWNIPLIIILLEFWKMWS
jgi:hypothetical protein